MEYFSFLQLYFLRIPLMMINYANRSSSLRALIRRINDDLVESRESKVQIYVKKYLEQIQILRRRLYLNRTFQTLGSVSFF